jgi:hypothetical protein
MLTYNYYKENLSEFKKYKSKDLVPFDCSYCNKRYFIIQRICRQAIKYRNNKNNYCSNNCIKDGTTKALTAPCGNCKNPVTRALNVFKHNKNHVFCNSSCAAIYNNTHKTTGNRRSKLECYLEDQLKLYYPDLDILVNGKETIESELDFYFPQLRFAVELNGIFHYEPIYGNDKLERIQNNDKQKLIRCYEQGIELMVLDTSSQKRFTVKSSQKYVDIIKDQIDNIIKRKEPA